MKQACWQEKMCRGQQWEHVLHDKGLKSVIYIKIIPFQWYVNILTFIQIKIISIIEVEYFKNENVYIN